MGDQGFTVALKAGVGSGEAVSGFVKQYYMGQSYFPAEVLLPASPPDAEVSARWLSERRGRKVAVLAPRRGGERRRGGVAYAGGGESPGRGEVGGRGRGEVYGLQVSSGRPVVRVQAEQRGAGGQIRDALCRILNGFKRNRLNWLHDEAPPLSPSCRCSPEGPWCR